MSTATLDRTAIKDQWLSHFSMLETGLNGKGRNFLPETRKTAIQAFNEIGFPTTRDEAWKYTSVRPLLAKDFRPAFFPQHSGLSATDIEPYVSFEPNAWLLVFVNGFFQVELSRLNDLPSDILVTSLSRASETHPDLLKDHFAQHANPQTDGFLALNTAFALDGALIHVPKGKTSERPFHILSLCDARETNSTFFQRNILLLEENAMATVIETQHTIGGREGLAQIVTEGAVASHGHLDHYIIQNNQKRGSEIRNTFIDQEKKSNYWNATISLKGDLMRNNLHVRLNGEHCETHMNGLYHLQGDSHVDNRTFVDHASPNCYSNELYKGVLDGNSTGVFNGRIMVRQDAQKTNAFQSNKNLLLSETASVNTKPQLEIFADDVKCSHGATTGQLDRGALFYLRSRAIGETEARAMLTYAFAADVVHKIKPEGLMAYLESIIASEI